MQQKKIFKEMLVVFAIIMCVLPVIATFSAALTSLFNHMGWYIWLQNFVAPYEARLVAVLVRLVGIKGEVATDANFSMVLIKGTTLIPIRLEWNCLGWQSMILLALTLATGLRGPHTILSKVETLIIGIAGTFLINLFRMSFIVSMAYYWSSFAAIIMHDYFASFVALIWMVFFWWFSYTYVLEDYGEYTQRD